MTIVYGIFSTNHAHMFVEMPPYIAASRFVQRVKGRTYENFNWSFLHCVNDIEGSVSGPEANGLEQHSEKR